MRIKYITIIIELYCNILLSDLRLETNQNIGYVFSGYFDREFYDYYSEYLTMIAEELQNDSYYVKNLYNKYYVIAFALNYTRFEIYSKLHEI